MVRVIINFGLAFLYSLYLSRNKKEVLFLEKHFYHGGFNKDVMKIKTTMVEMLDKENRVLLAQIIEKQIAQKAETDTKIEFLLPK